MEINKGHFSENSRGLLETGMGQLPPLYLAETQRQAAGGELYGGEEKVQVRLLEALGKSKWGEWWQLPVAVAFHERSGRHTFFWGGVVLSWKQKQNLGRLQSPNSSCFVTGVITVCFPGCLL